MMIRKLAWLQMVLLFTCAMNDYKFVVANNFNYNSTTILLTEDFTDNKFNGWSCDRIINSSGLVCEARYTTFSATDRSDIPKTNIQKTFTVTNGHYRVKLNVIKLDAWKPRGIDMLVDVNDINCFTKKYSSSTGTLPVDIECDQAVSTGELKIELHADMGDMTPMGRIALKSVEIYGESGATVTAKSKQPKHCLAHNDICESSGNQHCGAESASGACECSNLASHKCKWGYNVFATGDYNGKFECCNTDPLPSLAKCKRGTGTSIQPSNYCGTTSGCCSGHQPREVKKCNGRQGLQVLELEGAGECYTPAPQYPKIMGQYFCCPAEEVNKWKDYVCDKSKCTGKIIKKRFNPKPGHCTAEVGEKRECLDGWDVFAGNEETESQYIFWCCQHKSGKGKGKYSPAAVIIIVVVVVIITIGASYFFWRRNKVIKEQKMQPTTDGVQMQVVEGQATVPENKYKA